MKAKIAKQEGEVRSAKKLNDQLNKHIRMLEQALTNERAKNKAAAAGGDAQAAADEKKDAKAKAASKSGMEPKKRERACSILQILRLRAQLTLSLCSTKQAPQLLPRRGSRTLRASRSGARQPTREIEIIHEAVFRRDNLPSDTAPSTGPTAGPTWARERLRILESWGCFNGGDVSPATTPSKDAVAAAYHAEHVYAQSPTAVHSYLRAP